MFRVRWKRGAVNDLATIWMNADSKRRRILDVAANTIDFVLSNNPGEVGEISS